MVKVEDPAILDESARNEYADPLPQKVCDDGRVIYLSRNNYGRPRRACGLVCITDFDMSVRGDGPHYGPVGAAVFRAPEIVLDAGFSYSTDMWSLGVTVKHARSLQETSDN